VRWTRPACTGGCPSATDTLCERRSSTRSMTSLRAESPQAMVFNVDSDEWTTASGKDIDTGVLRRDEDADIDWYDVAAASQK
jgi:hypothetical protein